VMDWDWDCHPLTTEAGPGLGVGMFAQVASLGYACAHLDRHLDVGRRHLHRHELACGSAAHSLELLACGLALEEAETG